MNLLMNKRADASSSLLGTTGVKLVLAVICILFLFFFLKAIYSSQVNTLKIKQAAATLNSVGEGSLQTKISSLFEGESTQFQLLTPKSWYLMGFVNNKKPNSCVGQNCLCICDHVFEWFGIASDKQFEECDKHGACLIVENLKEFSPIKIQYQNITIQKLNNLIELIE
jgi:hypothetical protein